MKKILSITDFQLRNLKESKEIENLNISGGMVSSCSAECYPTSADGSPDTAPWINHDGNIPSLPNIDGDITYP